LNTLKTITCCLAAALSAEAPMAAASAPGVPAHQLRIGAAKVDITPTDLAGLNPMGGGAFSGVHDAIYARALILEDGRTAVAIVSIDAIEVGDMTPLRQRIASEVGIPFGNIMITATHDHSAPRIGDVSPGALAHPGGVESRAFTQRVFDQVVGALKRAKANEKAGSFGLGKGTADVNVNRDEYVPGKGWGLGFNPDGPSDKTVWVLRFDDDRGKPIAVLFNYAVHNDVTLGSNEISGDLSGVAQTYVERNLGPDVIALWTMGAAGDQDPRIFPKSFGGPPSGGTKADGLPPAMGGSTLDPAILTLKYQAMEAQGVMVGGEVVRVAGTVRNTSSDVRLAAASRDVACPTKQGVDQLSDMTTVKVPNVDLRLGVILINDVALASVGGEVVTNINTQLRRSSPLANTIMVTLANDRIGYIADDAAYDRPIFEVNGSPMARGCAENAIVDGLTGMIRTSLR
jgi:hypothetical protein